MSNERILVVEDEPDIVELVTRALARHGFRVDAAASGEEAVRKARQLVPDVVILDLMLPGIDGMEVCRMLRGDPRTAAAPIIMLTARSEEADMVAGLEVGADDYVAKPFSPKVLAARVRAILRRREKAPAAGDDVAVAIHDLVITPGRHEVLAAGRPLVLTFSEFRILHLLARRPGWVFSRDQVVDAVHGEDYPVTDRSIDVQVVGLRRKLGPKRDYIETVRGVGYRFRETL